MGANPPRDFIDESIYRLAQTVTEGVSRCHARWFNLRCLCMKLAGVFDQNLYLKRTELWQDSHTLGYNDLPSQHASAF
jgi:hypothetical protein